jgi:phosphoglycerate dehydrogenase-like enzyme
MPPRRIRKQRLTAKDHFHETESLRRPAAGAGLNVYWRGPYLNEPPLTEPWVPEELCKLDNVMLAPHNAGATWDVRGRKAASVGQGMVALMRGERPVTLMNPEIYASA